MATPVARSLAIFSAVVADLRDLELLRDEDAATPALWRMLLGLRDMQHLEGSAAGLMSRRPGTRDLMGLAAWLQNAGAYAPELLAEGRAILATRRVRVIAFRPRGPA